MPSGPGLSDVMPAALIRSQRDEALPEPALQEGWTLLPPQPGEDTQPSRTGGDMTCKLGPVCPHLLSTPPNRKPK